MGNGLTHIKGGQTAVGGKLNQWGFKLKLRKCVCMCMSSIVVGKSRNFFQETGACSRMDEYWE